MPKVVITIAKNGQVRREAFGFTGPECLQRTQFLDKIFGKPDTEELKDSYYEESDNLADGLPSGYCG